MWTLTVDKILVALKATDERNVNFYCWLDSSWKLQLTGMSALTLDRILVATIDRNVSLRCLQAFGGSKSCSYLIGQLMGIRASFWCQVALKATVANSDNCQRIRVLEVLQQFFVLFSVNSLEHSHYPITSNKPVNL